MTTTLQRHYETIDAANETARLVAFLTGPYADDLCYLDNTGELRGTLSTVTCAKADHMTDATQAARRIWQSR